MKRLILAFVFIVVTPSFVWADESDDIEFNQDFLGDSGQQVTTNLSRFKQKNTLLPGIYLSDIYVNGKWIGRQDLIFQDTDTISPHATVCFKQSLLQLFGIDFSVLPESVMVLLQQSETDGQCHALDEFVPDAQFYYDANALRAEISIPQYYLFKHARGYIHPKFWDQGVPAATVGYQFNAYHYDVSGHADTTYYLGLNNGVNVNGWRLRNQSVMTKSGHQDWHYQTIATYLKHDVTALHSQLLIGDTYTSSNLFDSVGFRGIQLSSDERMLPDSLVGYAPVVRGIAKSNAKVAIYQQELLIYETTVAPGAFEINDLYATGQSGDLKVIVTESDGEQYQYIVPNLSFSPLLREGAVKYGLTWGKTRSTGLGRVSSSLLQLEGGVGIFNGMTQYGGVLLAKNYRSVASSSAFATPFGAVAFGVNYASAKVGQQHYRGQSFNVKYSHQLQETDTSLSLAAYHYFSPHYYTLGDMLHAQSAWQEATSSPEQQTLFKSAVGQQHQLQLSIAQYLGPEKGTLFVSGSLQHYWGTSKKMMQYLLGYSNNYEDMTYQLTLQRQKSIRRNKMETQIAIALSFPLGKKMNAPTVSMNHYQAATPTTSVAVNGTIDQDNTLSYGLSGARSGQHYSTSLSTQYRAPYALFNAGYSQGYHYSQVSGNVSGGIVAHPGGVTLAQGLGESIAIIEAKGAAGAKVNINGVSVDRLGYAVVPFLTPYRVNQVELDPKGISFDVELSTTSQRVTPRAGAVVMLKYPTLTGRSVLINATIDHQDDMPFGAEVFDDDQHYVGMTGQGGNIFVRGLQKDDGVLTVKWGKDSDGQCQIAYHLPPKESLPDADLLQIEANCEKTSPVAVMPPLP